MTIPPAAVLDTNVVLDCYLFRDPAALALAHALDGGQVCWLACASMRAELGAVLAPGRFDRWHADRHRPAEQFDRLARVTAEPAVSTLRCRDPADQVFLDLALAADARWLFTRDKALLELARKVRHRDLAIVPPGRWAAPVAAPATA